MWILAVASATSLAQEADPLGDARAGAGKVAMCVGCHGIPGYRASFPELYRVPKISGQGAPYIASALAAYKKGERKHPSMRAIAESLSEQDMLDIAAYYADHAEPKVASSTSAPSTPVPAQIQALLDKGACLSCHGEGFAKPIDPAYPKVAGQYADYLYAALKAYRVQDNPHVGRSNPVMAPIAGQFSNHELKTLAQYLSGLEGDMRTVPQRSFRLVRD